MALKKFHACNKDLFCYLQRVWFFFRHEILEYNFKSFENMNKKHFSISNEKNKNWKIDTFGSAHCTIVKIKTQRATSLTLMWYILNACILENYLAVITSYTLPVLFQFGLTKTHLYDSLKELKQCSTQFHMLNVTPDQLFSRQETSGFQQLKKIP